jgi:alkylmercury lyase-like protein
LANLVILTADELKTLNPLERQAARRAARQQPLVRLILRTFLQRSGPIPVEDLIAASPGGHGAALRDALVALDDDDLIRVRAGQIDIAYPFSGASTPFRVRLSGGRERYACCATDALGIAPMVGEPIEITSSCHHCGEPLKFAATPQGVGPDAEGVMVWFGQRGDEGCKAFDSL